MRNTTYILTFAITLVFIACNTEEPIEPLNQDTKSLVLNIDNTNDLGCLPLFPVLYDSDPNAWQYDDMSITYKADLTEPEIICIRRQYFDAFPLKMAENQPSDSHEDLWKIWNIRVDQKIDTTICDDPRIENLGGDCDSD